MKGTFVCSLTWDQLEEHVKANALAVIPVGAAAKEHGLHLPLNTDQLQIEWLCKQLVLHMPVLVWPTIHYGYYPAFVEFPGSTHIDRETFVAFLKEVLASIARAGHTRGVILNSGISTIDPLNEVKNTFGGLDVDLINIYSGTKYSSAAESLKRQSTGGHADELETSIMLAIAPEEVDLEKAFAWSSATMSAGSFRRFDKDHPNYTPSGVYGDPTLASADKGRHLIMAMLDDVLNHPAMSDHKTV